MHLTEMPDTYRKRFLLHARTPGYRRRLALATARVKHMLASVDSPYIAFSGGKDSHCVLALVREQTSEVPAVYFDADCAYPAVLALLEKTERVIKHPASEPFLRTLTRLGLSHPQLEAETMRTTVYEPIKTLIARYRFDGVFYGLRAEESAGRRRHALVKGSQFTYKNSERGREACQPIWDWTYLDVWAFITAKMLPYCDTYNLMWHLPEREQRISYFAGESNRQFGRYARLKAYHPELYNRIVSVLPEVREFV